MKLKYFVYIIYWAVLTPFIFVVVHNTLALRDKIARIEVLDKLQETCEDKVMENIDTTFVKAHNLCKAKIKREFPNE